VTTLKPYALRWRILPQDPIDMVITWASVNDLNWRKNYEIHVKRKPQWQRHLEFGELELCLASVCKYMPWIRNIFLITECKTPEYVNNNSKVKVIHSHDILGKEALRPTFNSNVIESYMHRIPGLSECFLWGNDDFFVGQPIAKSYWFKDGLPSVKLGSRHLDYPIKGFEWSIYNAVRLASKFTGSPPPPVPSIVRNHHRPTYINWEESTILEQTHQINILRKSACEMVWRLFPDFMRQMVVCRIRDPLEHQLQFHLLAALVGIHAKNIHLDRLPPDHIRSSSFYDLESEENFALWLTKVLENPPPFYCINGIRPSEINTFHNFKQLMLRRIHGK